MEASAPPEHAEPSRPRTRIGRYHLLRRLAAGHVTELHLACAEVRTDPQEVVVLEHVLPDFATESEFVALFREQLRIAATLDHPNVVRVNELGESGPDCFYVMEYVHGRSAAEMFRTARTQGPVPLEVALAITMRAASALHYIHEAVDLSGERLGLIHCGVCPDNLLVGYDGTIKLTEFGIAKATERLTITMTGVIKSKFGYMSPERCRGEPLDRRNDLFALGVVLFELTTCERLFPAFDDVAVIRDVIDGSFDKPSERRADYPPALEAIVLRALATNRSERYASADEMLGDLQAFAHEHGLQTSATTVAAWMTDTFGRPPHPRAELPASKP